MLSCFLRCFSFRKPRFILRDAFQITMIIVSHRISLPRADRCFAFSPFRPPITPLMTKRRDAAAQTQKYERRQNAPALRANSGYEEARRTARTQRNA